MGSKACEEFALNVEGELKGANAFENEIVAVDPKRKRVDTTTDLDGNEPVIQSVNMSKNGPKNVKEAGPVMQARLDK